MGKSAPAPPPAPNPTVIADAQANANAGTARLQASLNMTTPEGQTLVQAIQALPAAFAAAAQAKAEQLQAQIDEANAALGSEKQDHADDLTAVAAAIQSITPPSPASA